MSRRPLRNENNMVKNSPQIQATKNRSGNQWKNVPAKITSTRNFAPKEQQLKSQDIPALDNFKRIDYVAYDPKLAEEELLQSEFLPLRSQTFQTVEGANGEISDLTLEEVRNAKKLRRHQSTEERRALSRERIIADNKQKAPPQKSAVNLNRLFQQQEDNYILSNEIDFGPVRSSINPLYFGAQAHQWRSRHQIDIQAARQPSQQFRDITAKSFLCEGCQNRLQAGELAKSVNSLFVSSDDIPAETGPTEQTSSVNESNFGTIVEQTLEQHKNTAQTDQKEKVAENISERDGQSVESNRSQASVRNDLSLDDFKHSWKQTQQDSPSDRDSDRQLPVGKAWIIPDANSDED